MRGPVKKQPSDGTPLAKAHAAVLASALREVLAAATAMLRRGWAEDLERWTRAHDAARAALSSDAGTALLERLRKAEAEVVQFQRASEAQHIRATDAEAERDALKAEVEAIEGMYRVESTLRASILGPALTDEMRAALADPSGLYWTGDKTAGTGAGEVVTFADLADGERFRFVAAKYKQDVWTKGKFDGCCNCMTDDRRLGIGRAHDEVVRAAPTDEPQGGGA